MRLTVVPIRRHSQSHKCLALFLNPCGFVDHCKWALSHRAWPSRQGRSTHIGKWKYSRTSAHSYSRSQIFFKNVQLNHLSIFSATRFKHLSWVWKGEGGKCSTWLHKGRSKVPFRFVPMGFENILETLLDWIRQIYERVPNESRR